MRGGDSTGTKPIPLGGEAQAHSPGKLQGSKRVGAGGERCTASIVMKGYASSCFLKAVAASAQSAEPQMSAAAAEAARRLSLPGQPAKLRRPEDFFTG